MKVGVVGLWHLGCVTAACLAEAGFEVVAFDGNPANIAKLQHGKAPLFEPGLDDLIQAGLTAKRLHFTQIPSDLAAASIVWITLDTPVDDDDIADVNFVINAIETVLENVAPHTLILISSQLPVGTMASLQQAAQSRWPEKDLSFACSPENLRLGKALDIFKHPDRIIMGVEQEADKLRLTTLLSPFTQKIVWMKIASAEMTKHALNAFLATSVVFINEIASLCELVGADAREVEQGLKSEERIGKKAYLRPGPPIAGGTLARDVNYLTQIARKHATAVPLVEALMQSNAQHKRWSYQRLLSLFTSLQGKTITMLGLTYKPGTDTLRRSAALEMCQWLVEGGATVVAFDPVIQTLPTSLQWLELKPTLEAALYNADAVVVGTEWPEFRSLTADLLHDNTKQPVVLDASGFLANHLGQDKRIHYLSVGSCL